MSLYEVMDEISQKQAVKTELGDNRMYGVALGIVAKNYDKEMPGRLCVTVPSRDKDGNELKWARLSMVSGGKKWGHFFMPEIGDQVLLAFENGNIEKPFVIGAVFMDNSSFLTGSADENNKIKRIVTKNGSSIAFEDGDQDGTKDKILVQTAGKTHKLLLDNENHKILLSDEKGNDKIEMDTENGRIKLSAQKRLEIVVGDTVKVVMNGESGAIKIEAGDVTIKAGRQLKLETDGALNGKGAQVMVSGSSMTKVESSGILKLSGTPVKLG